MASVLTIESSVTCGLDPGGINHGGNVDKVSTAKLKVNGKSVLLKSGIGPAVSGCKTPPSNSTKACTLVNSVTAGESIKLKVGGKGVLLAETLLGATDGKPIGTLSAIAKQTKLKSI